MSETIPRAAIEAARAYEDLHVAALFAEWAPRVLEALAVQPGAEVLDIACGTGVLARAALARVGAAGSVTGVDLSPAMLAVARDLAPAVTWQQGDALRLPFDAASFDAAANQFGLMFVADRAAAIGEMVRVVRGGGRIAVAVWDALDASPVYPIEVELLDRIAGSAAADALRAPFVLGNAAQLGELFAAAGAEDIEISTIRGSARFPSLRAMVEADLRGWLPVMGVQLDGETIERILNEAEQALGDFVTAQGTLEFESPAHIVAGTRPR